jgi:hypothetical protein
MMLILELSDSILTFLQESFEDRRDFLKYLKEKKDAAKAKEEEEKQKNPTNE